MKVFHKPWRIAQSSRAHRTQTMSAIGYERSAAVCSIYHYTPLVKIITNMLTRLPTLWVRHSQLTFIAQFMPRSPLFLQRLQSVRRTLTTHSAKDLEHAVIASRLDCCNSVLYRWNTTVTKTLQSVLRSAAPLIMRKWKFERITPTLREDLHWLPVPERIVFKLCTIVFKCLHQTAPQYLQELCVPVTARVGLPIAATCALPLVGTYKCLPVVRPASDHAALLTALQNCGTICHRHLVIQHWHLHFSAAG